MNQGLIPKGYEQNLIDIALSLGFDINDKCYTILQYAIEYRLMIYDQPAFCLFLSNPQINIENKKEFIGYILGNDLVPKGYEQNLVDIALSLSLPFDEPVNNNTHYTLKQYAEDHFVSNKKVNDIIKKAEKHNKFTERVSFLDNSTCISK